MGRSERVFTVVAEDLGLAPVFTSGLISSSFRGAMVGSDFLRSSFTALTVAVQELCRLGWS